MILTVAELCDKAAQYLQSISVGNKNYSYTPTDSLKNGGIIKTYNFDIQCPDYCTYYDKGTEFLGMSEEEVQKLITIGYKTVTINMNIKTNEDIPEEYLKPVSNDDIKQDWDTYKQQCIYTKLNSTAYVGVTSLFVFLYLFRYFVDIRFCQFSDIYTKTHIWLYKTGDLEYNPASMELASKSFIDKSMMDAYINTLIEEIVNRDTHRVLGAATSTNSCSSSSSSSSCSSSSSSSSCSSSSSSSSSLFIAYFNLG